MEQQTASSICSYGYRTSMMKFSDANIIKSWLSLKRQYPMLCAQSRSHEGAEKFFVEEKRVASLNQGELIFGSVSSAVGGETGAT
jgi:hypothetical protein